tara:strand:+ start:10542 stop:11381 length:840 start_codon:yes stop_codon:yes gene_type:complete
MRVGPKGQEKPAALAADGSIRDLSEIISDISGDVLNDAGIEELRKIDLLSLPELSGTERIGPCVGQVGKFLCIGLNYADHAEESGLAIPEEPVMFMKATSAIVGPNDDVIIPKDAEKTDWEVELGIVIGTEASYVSRETAMSHVAGYCVINDVSERAFQIERGGQWVKGKSCDTFGPMGPWMVTRDEVKNPQDLRLWLEVDGHKYQDGNTSTMIFPVDEIVSYVSQFMSLQPGDVISTGTPPGVGLGQKPDPIYLKSGQEMKLGIEGLGEQLQRTISHE